MKELNLLSARTTLVAMKARGRIFGNGIGCSAILAISWTAATIQLGTVQVWSQTLSTVSASDAVLNSKPSTTNIWQGEVGQGFRSSVQTVSLEMGAAAGFQAFGGEQNHNLALISLSYGHMLGGVVGDDHWYRGNWEARGELFSGGQFSPLNRIAGWANTPSAVQLGHRHALGSLRRFRCRRVGHQHRTAGLEWHFRIQSTGKYRRELVHAG